MTLKRTPLKRTASLTRTPMSQNRKPLAPRSQKRTDELPGRRLVRAEVLVRDRVCQVRVIGSATAFAVGRCFGPLTPHHRRKEGRGGAYTLENLVAVCAHHNGALEADADLARWAHSVGLVVKQGDAEWAKLGSTRR